MKRCLRRARTPILAILAFATLAGGPGATVAAAPSPARPAFELIALGVQGGLVDGDLSAWLVRPRADRHYLALDAGSLLPGIGLALRNGAFADQPPPPGPPLGRAGAVLRDQVEAYFISHGHLDHVAGLVSVSPDDRAKPVYGLAATLATLRQSYFNGSAWPNLTDGGVPPALGRYHLAEEAPGQPFAIEASSMLGRIYPLRHDRVTSSMILLQAGDDYLAYFGDTGPDAVQHAGELGAIWRVLAPLLRRHALKGLVIETSYPDQVADSRLYGHLTPAWLWRELHRLERQAGGGSLRGLDVVITHIKPSLDPARDPRGVIIDELRRGNDLGVRLHFPRQGDRLGLPDAALPGGGP